MLSHSSIDHASEYFRNHYGVGFDDLVAPIGSDNQAGASLKSNGVYVTIQNARFADDHSSPLGQWERELKSADWERVGKVAADALVGKSKDLQLAMWLLEAQIHRTGFAGIGPCLWLIREFCERFWDCVHPQVRDGDLEYRCNIFRWMNAKLLPALRLVPITVSGRAENYCWADWERALRNEQIRSSRQQDTSHLEGITIGEFNAALAATPADICLNAFRHLGDALEACAFLADTINRDFGDQAPSISAFTALLEQIRSLLASDLRQKGVNTAPVEAPPESAVVESRESDAGIPVSAIADSGAVRNRAEAYARLAELANFLAQDDPHSPGPCLIRRAIAWGAMDTATLYHELFVKSGGQLNIFELLGIEVQPPANQ